VTRWTSAGETIESFSYKPLAGTGRFLDPRIRHAGCFDPLAVHPVRPLWIRDLRLYRASALDDWPAPGYEEPADAGPHVRSRFRSLSDPECAALYSMRDAAGPSRLGDTVPLLAESHTLVVVREFRRVPLDASTLALVLFSACEDGAARVIATLAHWAERAVSAYQPAYLLLAHSLEQPRVSALLAAVHEGRAPVWTRPFSVESVLPEVRPWLDDEPEPYVYWPEDSRSRRSRPLSPYAV
jgi:hypothetical protein